MRDARPAAARHLLLLLLLLLLLFSGGRFVFGRFGFFAEFGGDFSPVSAVRSFAASHSSLSVFDVRSKMSVDRNRILEFSLAWLTRLRAQMLGSPGRFLRWQR